MKTKNQKGFEILSAAIWIFAFGCLAILTQKFLVERRANFSQMQKLQVELDDIHRSANLRKWNSSDPRNKRWRRQLLIQKKDKNKSRVEHPVVFDSRSP